MPGSDLRGVAQVGFGTPWQAQIDFLRNKLRLPTKHWDDIQKSANDRAFIVAGAAKADLLAELHQAVIDAGASGGGLRQFQKNFPDVAARNGWTGWTGEGTKAGEAWRARIIYQTNMATSYAAGRYQQLMSPQARQALPYWRYIHSDSVVHPRPFHLSWHGVTLPNDHPFWQTHFAPNGWFCHCRIVGVTRKEGEASAQAGLGAPPDGWDRIDPKTGAPVGIDKGFDYAPGAQVDVPLRKFVQDKLITHPDAITRALTVDVNRFINASSAPADYVREVLADGSRTDPLWLGFVENYQVVNEQIGADVKGYMVLLPADAVRHVQTHHEWDGGSQRPATAEDFANLGEVLNNADKLRPGTPENGHERVVATKVIAAETYRAVFEVRVGKKNRALALVTLAIKTAQ